MEKIVEKTVESPPKQDNAPVEAAAAAAPEKETTGWTKSQDDSILSMKAEGKSWADICAVTKRSKKDVQARFKELSADVEAASKFEPSDSAHPIEAQNDSPQTEEARTEDHPQTGRLEADGIWSREDCETLELLEQRYRDHKWLQMQAGFYNMTGRMVSADIIRLKFGA